MRAMGSTDRQRHGPGYRRPSRPQDADGEFEVQHLSNLTTDEAVELGSKPGGFRLSHGFISPLDLVEIGLLETEVLHAMETAAAETKQ